MGSNSSSSPNPPDSRFFVWILLLAAFGAPSAAYFSFPSFISQHLSQGISLLCFYEALIVSIAIVKFFWKEFRLPRAFVNFIRRFTIYPFYTSYYQKHLLEIFNDDIVLGLDGPDAITKVV
jgi:hypothetical protein